MKATENHFTEGYYVFAFQDEVLEALKKDWGNTSINKGDARTNFSKSKKHSHSI